MAAVESIESCCKHWWDKYSKSNLEFLTLLPDGTRSPHPTPYSTKLSESNPNTPITDRTLRELRAPGLE